MSNHAHDDARGPGGARDDMAPREATRGPLRCATAGSVDDGKSTLIGRLLFDTDTIFADQLSHVADVSQRQGKAEADLSLVTDGLRAEREQGITIDVAWRFATTPLRRFILADAPGHVQYTRNTLTAASTADVLLVLVDPTKATDGLLPQTKRHLAAGLFLSVPNVVIVVNKMDAVGFAHDAFVRAREWASDYASKSPLSLGRPRASLSFFPVSALSGDNVVRAGTRMPWFDGPTLYAHLAELGATARTTGEARFSVQWVRRPRIAKGGRGYVGVLSSGVLREGDHVKIAASGLSSRIESIETLDGPSEQVNAGHSATITLADEIDVSRGDVCLPEASALEPTREVELDLAWVGRETLAAGATLLLKHGAKKVRATVKTIVCAYDVESNVARPVDALRLNDFGRVRVVTSEPLAWAPYGESREGGRAILISRGTADTVAVAIFRGP